jgi:predicted membrane-bound mannosyltransferase
VTLLRSRLYIVTAWDTIEVSANDYREVWCLLWGGLVSIIESRAWELRLLKVEQTGSGRHASLQQQEIRHRRTSWPIHKGISAIILVQ